MHLMIAPLVHVYCTCDDSYCFEEYISACGSIYKSSVACINCLKKHCFRALYYIAVHAHSYINILTSMIS